MLDDRIQTIIMQYRWQIASLLAGFSLIGLGIFYTKINTPGDPQIEVVDNSQKQQGSDLRLVVEVSGSVINPGVYDFSENDRIIDAINKAGGLSDGADLNWINKYLNKAAKLTDGTKLYIPSVDEQSNNKSANISERDQGTSSTLGTNISNNININTASKSELESMWGIGPVTAQNIIEQRPYSSVQELLDKKIIKTNVYERNKDIMSVY